MLEMEATPRTILPICCWGALVAPVSECELQVSLVTCNFLGGVARSEIGGDMISDGD